MAIPAGPDPIVGVEQLPGVHVAGGTSTTLAAAGAAASALTAVGTTASLTASGTP